MTDYQDALVLENLDLVNWVIRTRISIPNRPLLTYDDFYAIGCEAICRAALKYQPDMGAFAPFACRYIYNAIVDHCRAMNYRLERNVEISEDENASLLDMLTCTSVDFDETVSNYARDQVGKPQEIPIEFYCEIPAPEIAPIDDGLWRVIEDNLTYKQFEAIQFRNQGYTNREIAELCGVGRKAIEKRFARIRKILSDYKEN